MISIIIPTYSRAELLREALDSIRAFVNAEVEVLICDDGSTDDTPTVCREYEGRGLVIIHSRTEERLGAQEARNRGLRQCTGDPVMFMDSDDALAGPGIVHLLSALEREPELGFSYGKVLLTDLRLHPYDPPMVTGEPFENVPRELAGYHWHTMGALYRRRALEAVGGWNPELSGSQDWEFQARVKLYGGRGVFVDTLVGLWRRHDGERVGGSKFRPDYVSSVMKACDSILSHARKAGRCDAALESRIAKRLAVHALEWGGNGFSNERRECFLQAAMALTDGGHFSRLLRLLAWTPRVFDRWIWERMVGRLQAVPQEMTVKASASGQSTVPLSP